MVCTHACDLPTITEGILTIAYVELLRVDGGRVSGGLRHTQRPSASGEATQDSSGVRTTVYWAVDRVHRQTYKAATVRNIDCSICTVLALTQNTRS